MREVFYKYQGAGNDFLIADNRDGHISERNGVLYCERDGVLMWEKPISEMCDRRYGVGADGLMLLESSDCLDFRMTYFNSDGSGGMMCGNGGRCIVAFAADCGISHFDFEAADGFHTAEILSEDYGQRIVRLKMKDVAEITPFESLEGVSVPSDGCFLDTGTRHYVRLVDGLDGMDVVTHGRDIRSNACEFLPLGVNVNFVEPSGGLIKVRTYEKGVEDETYACGTGIVASVLAAFAASVPPSAEDEDGRVRYEVRALKDMLAVDFIPGEGMLACDVWLTGPATCVARVTPCF